VEYTTTVENAVTTSETKFYLDDFAVVIETPNCHKLHYLNGDRLGSIDTITNAQGDVVERHGYDAFGKPRAGNWLFDSTAGGELNARLGLYSTVTHRGFTGHEHLDSVGLIHMNGRAYDPELGRFLSVDPFIQFPDNSQSLNPYTYVMNNPLSGTDPTGYVSERFLGRGATVIFDRTLGIGMGNTPLQFNTNTANITPDVLTPIEPNEMGVIVSDHVIKIGVGKDWTLVITKPASGAVVTLNVKTEEKIKGKVAPADAPVTVGSSDQDDDIGPPVDRTEVRAVDEQGNQNAVVFYCDHTCRSDAQKGRTWGSYLPGTEAGDSAAQYWASRVVNSEWYEDPTARAGLFFSVLWTAQTAADTAFTLSTAGLSDVTYFAKLGYYRYIGPSSNPASKWVFASTNSTAPYASMAAAKSALQLPSMPTAYKAVNIPWWKPVAGSRSVWRNPQWGSGGGKEWYQGWKFPD